MPAWTTPQTWTAVVVTAPDMNREIRDNLGALHPSVVSSALTYNLVATDGHHVVVKVDATGGNRAVNLYTAVGNTGATVCVKKVDSSRNLVTVDPAGGELAETPNLTHVLTTLDDYVTLVSDGANWVIVAERRAMNLTTMSGNYVATVYDDCIEALGAINTVLTLHAANAARRTRSLLAVNNSSAVMTVTGAGTDTIVGLATLDLVQYESVMLTPNLAGTAWIVS